MENYKKRAIELVFELAINETKRPEVVPYKPSKTEVCESDEPYFKRKRGGSGGRYARVLCDMLRELEAEPRANVHNLIVIKDGEVICEASAPGYDVNIPHLAHSMSKTLTAIAVGFLVDDGKLSVDERVAAFFPELEYGDKRFADLTVEDLITMKSGSPFSEIGTVTSDEWSLDFFETPLTFAPGEKFAYNSMNSYILAQIVTRVTGKPLVELLRERLLDPLKIKSFFWEKSPEGCEKGGFGAYMSCEAFAKVGVMLLGMGEFEGKEILSKRFVKRMLLTHSLASVDKGDFNYGYHVWVGREGSDFLLSGMLGQNVWVYPDENIVVSLNSGNNEIFQDSPALRIIKSRLTALSQCEKPTRADKSELKAVIKSFFKSRQRVKPEERLRGLLYFLKVKESCPFDVSWDAVLGEYGFPDNNVGILPLFVRVLQNNYCGGIESLELFRRGEELYMSVVEGGVEFEYPIGLYSHRETVVDYDGEKYIVRSVGRATFAESGERIFTIEMLFPELPNTRYIVLAESENGIVVSFSEMPNERVADKFIESFNFTGLGGMALGLLEKKLGENFIAAKLARAFNPTISGIDKRITECEEIISEKNRELSLKKENSGKFIRSLVSRFIGDSSAEKQKEQKKKPEAQDGEKKSFLSRAISSIKEKLSGKKKSSAAYDISVEHTEDNKASDGD